MRNPGERNLFSISAGRIKPSRSIAGGLLACVLWAGAISEVFSQANAPFPPPKEIRVYSIQGLSFGSFYTGATGGTVAVSPAGSRSQTGTVVLAGGMVQNAIFIVELLPGRLVSISFGPPATLLRIGGGGSMTMNIGPTNRGMSFVTSGGHPFFNPVQVGGTLNVGNTLANPPGNYEGTFSITFNQE